MNNNENALTQNESTNSNKSSHGDTAKSVGRSVAVVAVSVCATVCVCNILKHPVYDAIIEKDHGHLQVLISANNQRSEEKVSS